MSKRIFIRIFILISGLTFGWNQCIEGVEVELWGVCYNIEETTELNFDDTGLTGEIPNQIGDLVNLEYLYLQYNELTGEIPNQIGNLINLQELDFSGNQLTGEIPSEIGNLINLRDLGLSQNQLSGEIPSEIGNLSILEDLNLYLNNFSGIIPSEIGNLTYLVFMRLHNNELFGQIPLEICNLNLIQFYIFNNQLCPPYPECLTEESIGYQDTTNCSSMSISELSLPNEYTLHQPFPNPFNPTTSISFSIPEQSQTSLKVYDIKGNLISTLLNQPMNVGHHQIEWNGEYLSSGTYFIRINSGEFSDVKKVVLVK